VEHLGKKYCWCIFYFNNKQPVLVWEKINHLFYFMMLKTTLSDHIFSGFLSNKLCVLKNSAIKTTNSHEKTRVKQQN